jgi:hypothetical protein
VNPRTYTLTAKLPSNCNVFSKSAFTNGIPGARIDDAKGERHVIDARRTIMKNFLR